MARERNDADTVQRILHEATRLFVASGYEGVSMREIGEAVGITKAALYYHFQDKQDLFMAILNASLEEFGGVLDQAQASAENARGRIAATVQGLLELPVERRALIRVASQEMVHVRPETRAAFNEVYQQKFVGRIARMLQEGMERGELRAMNPQLAAWLLLGMAYPFFNLTHPSQPTADVTQGLVSVFLDGLGKVKTR